MYYSNEFFNFETEFVNNELKYKALAIICEVENR